MSEGLSAATLEAAILAEQSDEERRKILRYFKTGPGDYAEGDVFIGVRMGTIFKLAKTHIDLPPAEIETLMKSPIHELRVGALSVMGQKAAHRKTTPQELEALYDLYLRRHDRINNWDLVDLAAYKVLGRHLRERSRDPLYALARSDSLWERRSAIVATLHFSLKGDVEDAYAIAETLMWDPHDLTHKAVGWALRTAGGAAPDRHRSFLDRHAATMPRTMLRAAIENLPPETRAHYLGRKSQA